MPRNPYATPSYYPQEPSSQFASPALFAKLDVDTLFYIFYYRPGTYLQYLAANELKKQSWRFHKQYLTWFQRANEPTTITDSYEQGVYLYFDWEGASSSDPSRRDFVTSSADGSETDSFVGSFFETTYSRVVPTAEARLFVQLRVPRTVVDSSPTPFSVELGVLVPLGVSSCLGPKLDTLLLTSMCNAWFLFLPCGWATSG